MDFAGTTQQNASTEEVRMALTVIFEYLSRMKIRRIISSAECIQQLASSPVKNRTKNGSVNRVLLKEHCVNGVYDMYERRVHLSDALIQEKSNRILNGVNQQLRLSEQLELQCSKGW